MHRSRGESRTSVVQKGTPRTRVNEDLKRRCLARASAAREQLRAQHRFMGDSSETRSQTDASLVSAIIAEELRRVPPGQSEARPSAWSEADEAALQAALGKDAYLELMAATESELLRECERDAQQVEMDEQCRIAGEWSAGAAREYDEYLAAQAEEHEATGDEQGESAVLCPLCVRSRLTLSPDGFVTCCGADCALRLDARGHPAPVELLRERMDTLLQQHTQRCGGQPCCRLPLPAETSLGMLLFCCPACGCAVGVV